MTHNIDLMISLCPWPNLDALVITVYSTEVFSQVHDVDILDLKLISEFCTDDFSLAMF